MTIQQPTSAASPLFAPLDVTKISKATGATTVRASLWAPHLNAAMQRFGIDTPLRQAAFLAQLGHESTHLGVVVENLNYSQEALFRLFKRHFPTLDVAKQYHRQPTRIANRMYANRMGNGSEVSGDGWKFRGKGPIQITGKNNHLACGKALGLDLVKNPELLLEPEHGAASAGWFWSINKLNVYADNKDPKSISKAVNVGDVNAPDSAVIGLPERIALYNAAVKAVMA